MLEVTITLCLSVRSLRYTLGTPSWRNVEVDPQLSIWSLNYPTCVNGALHWIRFDFLQMSILCFNLENERFQSFPSPPHVFQNGRIVDGITDRRINMGELRGFLYICDSSSLFDVATWVMKEYGLGLRFTALILPPVLWAYLNIRLVVFVGR
ncbi:hypothetical protein MtrunA17_Chr5g0405911 [Medicago truncatula]|uniref:F-box associated beta-propeller type 1 domain-containing protein n=1 Tax=Medicago truncatula TaxID=3880 RepID=A0A396HSJ6_MEDTR|nr:hypothetical protein MtrunA17_Chr5g0405911 [Medicago truncatula]